MGWEIKKWLYFNLKGGTCFLYQVNNQRGYLLWSNAEFYSRYYGMVN